MTMDNLQPSLRSRSIEKVKNSGRNSATGRFDSKKNSARSNSAVMAGRRSVLNCDKSLGSVRSNGSRRFGVTGQSSNMNLSFDAQDLPNGGNSG